MTLLRGLGPLCLAVLAASWIGYRSRHQPLELPGFSASPDGVLRRGAAWTGLAIGLYLGVFLALGALGVEIAWSPPASSASLFLVHVILLLSMALWFGLGVAGADLSEPGLVARQLGLSAERPVFELLVGAGVGLGIWAAVLTCVVAFGILLSGVGLEGALPGGMPPMVEWIIAQPLWLRLLVSLSAGVVEELFFRGFLQPRIGLVGATVLFALAHLGYGEPFMLFGITLLSLSYGLLAKWRGSIYASIAAHAVFDAVQLLVLIPAAAAAAEVP